MIVRNSAYDALVKAFRSDLRGYQEMMACAANSRTLAECEYWLSQAAIYAESAIETMVIMEAQEWQIPE